MIEIETQKQSLLRLLVLNQGLAPLLSLLPLLLVPLLHLYLSLSLLLVLDLYPYEMLASERDATRYAAGSAGSTGSTGLIKTDATAACLLNASGSLSGRVAKRGDGLYALTFHSALTSAT